MRAITIWQPWATLIACAAKRFETRTHAATPGPIAIHAGAARNAEALDLCLREPFRAALVEAGINAVRELPYGAVLAIGEIVASHKTEDLRGRLSAQEVQFGDFSPGRYAWEIRIDQCFDEPVPARGQQGFWPWKR